MTNSIRSTYRKSLVLLTGAGFFWTSLGLAQEAPPSGAVSVSPPTAHEAQEAHEVGEAQEAPAPAPAGSPSEGSPKEGAPNEGSASGLVEVEPSSESLSTAPVLGARGPETESILFRRALDHSAEEEGKDRALESVLGFATGGALLGVGFAAEGPDMTWSHVLWVSGGVVAVASVLALLTPSQLEILARDAASKSDAQVREDWKRLAESAKLERRVGAVFGGLFGAASIVLGTLVLEDELGDMSRDNRTILGTTLVTGGGIGVTQSIVSWFQPSRLERDFSLAEKLAGPEVAFSVAPTPSGAAFGVVGRF